MTNSSHQQACAPEESRPARVVGRSARRAALAALLTAGLSLAPGRTRPAEGDARPVARAGDSKARVSQYTRFAQTPKPIGRKSARGPAPRAAGSGARAGVRGRR